MDAAGAIILIRSYSYEGLSYPYACHSVRLSRSLKICHASHGSHLSQHEIRLTRRSSSRLCLEWGIIRKGVGTSSPIKACKAHNLPRKKGFEIAGELCNLNLPKCLQLLELLCGRPVYPGEGEQLIAGSAMLSVHRQRSSQNQR